MLQMITEIFSTLFHLAFNSLLVFFVLALVVEIFLFVFRIKNARLRAFCRLMPLLKLPIDVFLYLGVEKHIFLNLNPFSCQQYLLNFFIPEGRYCSIPNFFALQLPHTWMALFLVLFFSFTAFIFGHKVFQILKTSFYLKEILSCVKRCERAIENEKLKFSLKGVQLLTSTKVEIPFATFGKRIVFPESLVEKLSQKEFEAIVAHEYQHLRWKDPILKMVCSLIATFFWWLPTSWWLKRFEWEQECASDSDVEALGVEPFDLAGGILTSMKSKGKGFKFAPICHVAMGNAVQRRLHRILSPEQLSEGSQMKTHFFMGAFLCLLAGLTFWIC
jgi:Zn-dependent protease with chaperone function